MFKFESYAPQDENFVKIIEPKEGATVDTLYFKLETLGTTMLPYDPWKK